MSVSLWSVMHYPILRPDHAKICFPLKQNVSRISLVFIQYFRSRMYFHSSKTNFTFRTANPPGLLRPLYNPLRRNHLGHFEHMSTCLFRLHFKAPDYRPVVFLVRDLTRRLISGRQRWRWVSPWLQPCLGPCFLSGGKCASVQMSWERPRDPVGHGMTRNELPLLE